MSDIGFDPPYDHTDEYPNAEEVHIAGRGATLIDPDDSDADFPQRIFDGPNSSGRARRITITRAPEVGDIDDAGTIQEIINRIMLPTLVADITAPDVELALFPTVAQTDGILNESLLLLAYEPGGPAANLATLYIYDSNYIEGSDPDPPGSPAIVPGRVGYWVAIAGNGLSAGSPVGHVLNSHTDRIISELVISPIDEGLGGLTMQSLSDNHILATIGRFSDAGIFTLQGGTIGSPVTNFFADSTVLGTGSRAGIISNSTGDAYLDLRIGATEQYLIGIDNSDGDKFKISDGSALGSGDRLIIIATGEIGLGGVTPAAGNNLHVQQSAVTSADYGTATDVQVLERNGDCYLNIIGNPANNSGILFSDDVRARGQILYNHGTGTDAMRFVCAGAEKVRIDSNGDLGVGTTSPDFRLDVVSNIEQIANFESSLSTAAIGLLNGSSATAFVGIESGSLYWGPDLGLSTENLVLDGQSKLGLGTVEPGLNVGGSTGDYTATWRLFHLKAAATAAGIIVEGTAALVDWVDLDATANQKIVRWQNSGGTFKCATIADDLLSAPKDNILSIALSTGNLTIGYGLNLKVATVAVNSATNNDVAVGDVAIVRFTSSDGSPDITSIAGGVDGRILHLFNASAVVVQLMDAAATGTAANRFELTANFSLGALDGCTIFYDGTSSRWRVLGNT